MGLMHFFLEDFVKERKKYKNPKTKHTGYDPLIPPNKVECKDHKGNVFKSYKEMCKIPPNKVECKDHKGNVFKSYKEMCKFYRVDYKRFLERKNILKLPIEKCLIRKKFRCGPKCKK